MNRLMQDLRYAFRQFRKSPGFTFTCVISLMLGIGTTTAIFSVIYAVLINPYPYKDAGRMVHVELRNKEDRGPLLVVVGRHVTRSVDAVWFVIAADAGGRNRMPDSGVACGNRESSGRTSVRVRKVYEQHHS